MTRVAQLTLITTFLAFSWLAMQGVHELGHVLAAVATGGGIQKVVLHPLAFSRTDVSPNPHPLPVVWAGPLLGMVLPVMAWLLARRFRWPHVFLWRFFAGFCLATNGVYLLGGALVHEADPGDLIRLGVPRAVLVMIGFVAVVGGFRLWHGEGRHFGLGPARGKVSGSAAAASVVLLALMVAAELGCGGR
ncbi:MAG: M50 family metallopeptidase [Verrucomicrobiales bacterium]|nr:M50 family metallopeptidase [Verrucomicrobiales bacterium]